jgi:mono/diheme cytochrome c family protein
MNHRAVAVCIATLFVASSVTLAQSPPAQRGLRLYENECIACHNESVHSRSPRAAKSLVEIRSYVTKWSGVVGTRWSEEEIEEVTAYLNERYYRFACPTIKC